MGTLMCIQCVGNIDSTDFLVILTITPSLPLQEKEGKITHHLNNLNTPLIFPQVA